MLFVTTFRNSHHIQLVIHIVLFLTGLQWKALWMILTGRRKGFQ